MNVIENTLAKYLRNKFFTFKLYTIFKIKVIDSHMRLFMV